MAFETSHAEVEQLTRVSFAPQVLTDRFEFGVEADHDKLCVFVRVPLLAWRANCDFRFLLDIDAVDNYCVKYATKDEKETEPFSKIMQQVVEKAVAEGKTVKNVFSSLLIKTIGERDYTAQEICGQLEQLPYVRYSRRMIKVNLGSVRALATKKAVDDDDKGHADAHDNDPDGDAADPGCDPDDPEEVQDAATENNVDRYARRHHEESLSLFRYIAERDDKGKQIEHPDEYRIPFPVPAFHPHPNGRNFEQYCRNRLLLHKPWRGDPNAAIGDHVTWEEALKSWLFAFAQDPDVDDESVGNWCESPHLWVFDWESIEMYPAETNPDGNSDDSKRVNYHGPDAHIGAVFREFTHWQKRKLDDEKKKEQREQAKADGGLSSDDEPDQSDESEISKRRRRNVPGATNLMHAMGADFDTFQGDDDDISESGDDQAEVDWAVDAEALGGTLSTLDCEPGRTSAWLSKQTWMRSAPSAPEKGAGGETPNEDSASRRRRLKGNQRLASMIAKEWIDGVAAALGRR